MIEFILSVIIIGIVIILMSVGLLMNKTIQGSCGGVGKALQEDDYQCEICGDQDKCINK